MDKELFVQSWTHYRHLEDQRQKMLVFFSTFLFSGLSVSGFLFKTSGSSEVNSEIYLIVFLILNTICMFGLVSLIYIMKAQAARSAHGAIIDGIIRRSYKDVFQESYVDIFYRTLQDNTPASIRTLLTYPRPMIKIGSSSAVIDQGVFTIFVFLGVLATALISVCAVPFAPPATMPVLAISCLLNLLIAKSCWDHIQTKQPSIVEHFVEARQSKSE